MLRLDFSPSYRLAGVLTLAHGMGLFSLWVTDWPLALKIVVAMLVCASGAFYVRRDALLQAPRSLTSLLLKSDGGTEATQRDGTTLTGRQLPGNFVYPWFTVIAWLPDGARFSRTVAVLSDSLAAEQFRELRVWLRWRRVEKIL